MDKICWNGRLTWPQEAGLDPGRLLSENYLYQRIHTYGHRALHLQTHLGMLAGAAQRVHGVLFTAGAEAVQRQIAALLGANRFPEGSNCVTIRVFPYGLHPDATGPDCLIETTAQLFYPRYTLWHHRPLLDVFPCDYPYAGYPTSAEALAARYAREFAQRRGAEIAVMESGHGILTNIDGEPLFAVFGRQVVTSPPAGGACDTVLRRLVLSLCRKAGITVTEYPLTRALLSRCDEAFTITVQGIVPILGYERKRYFNLTAVRLSEAMNSAETEIK